jgi:hypothetical protein
LRGEKIKRKTLQHKKLFNLQTIPPRLFPSARRRKALSLSWPVNSRTRELREAHLRSTLAIIHRNIFLFAEMRLPL